MTVPDRAADPLDAAVVATLQHAADEIPALIPPWDGVRTSLRRARRRRRLRLAGRVTAGVLAASCVLGGVQTGVLPYPGWAPAVTLPGSGAQPSALSRLPTKGSLAADQGWLDALRAKVSRFDQDEGGGEWWKVTSVDDVRVLFAGDVGAYRAALVEAPVRAGVLQSRMQLWYVGPRGASVSAVEPGQTSTAEDTNVVVLQQLPAGGDQTVPTTIVVSATASTVEVAGPPTLTPEGRQLWPVHRLTAVEEGLWTDVPTGSVTTGARAVRVGTEPWQEVFAGSTPLDLEAAQRLLSAQPPAHPAGAQADPQEAAGSVEQLAARFATGSADGSAGLSAQLLWHGSLGGWTVTGVVVTLPGGGRVLDLPQFEPTPRSDGGRNGTIAQVPLPAGRNGDLAVAVAMTAVGPNGDGDHPPMAGVGLIGPRAATRATVVDAAGHTRPVQLTDGVGYLATTDAVRAMFEDAHGHQLADVRVIGLAQGLLGPPS